MDGVAGHSEKPGGDVHVQEAQVAFAITQDSCDLRRAACTARSILYIRASRQICRIVYTGTQSGRSPRLTVLTLAA